MPYQPIVPDGQRLGTSHKVDGAVTGHLFDNNTNELKGHAAWEWVDEPEMDFSTNYESTKSHVYETPRELTPEERELAEQLAALIVASTVRALVTAAPHVKRWWNEKAALPAKSAWKRAISSLKSHKRTHLAASSAETSATFVASATTVEVADSESPIRMNSAEWEQRFRAMLAAGAFKDEQSRILSNARIEDSASRLNVKSASEPVTPQQFANRIRLMLEANPSLLDAETSAELMRIFSARIDTLGKPEIAT